MVKILISSDKYKGSLSAPEANRAIAEGIKMASPSTGQLSIREVPVADGGEGMAAALTAAYSGEWITCPASDALGSPVTAGYGWIPQQKMAVIEMAEASGLWRLSDSVNDPWQASTVGTGEMMLHAIKRGAGSIILGIGGSATNDGGTGMAQALGFRFLDAAGEEVPVPSRLDDVLTIERPSSVFPEISVACDVNNPLLGPTGSTRIYGPQKGIAEHDFSRHEQRLAHLVDLLDSESAAATPGSGAAGGLGFGCLAFLQAQLQPGFALVADALRLEDDIEWADLVITGEGKIDGQSDMGKAPAGVAAMARQAAKPVVAFCGLNASDPAGNDNFDQIWELERGDLSIDESMRQGAALLRKTAASATSELLRLGQ